MTTFYLLSDRRKTQTLKRELRDSKENNEVMKLQGPQKQSHQTALISESLRISPSVAGRLPRVNSTTAMEYKSYTTPAGTAVSMLIGDVHFN